jgi:hypothetical protein
MFIFFQNHKTPQLKPGKECCHLMSDGASFKMSETHLQNVLLFFATKPSRRNQIDHIFWSLILLFTTIGAKTSSLATFSITTLSMKTLIIKAWTTMGVNATPSIMLF